MMKRLNYILLLAVFAVLFSCNNAEKQSEIPVIDVTKSYPKKDIVLQDIADVEYIPLETRDDVLLSNNVRLCVATADSIFVGNYREGSIYLFNGKGEFLKKFNHKGASGQEYQEVWGILYDNKAQEVIVIDYPFQHRFQVYDINGRYKRTIAFGEEFNFVNSQIINYDDNTLLFYENLPFFMKNEEEDAEETEKTVETPYIFLSKTDGKIVGNLPIDLEERVNPNIIIKQEGGVAIMSATINSIVKNDDDIIISEISKDTIFKYSKDKKLEPIAIRTPEILSMEEPLAFLQIEKTTPKYLFGKIIGKETEEKNKFTTTRIVIDRATNEIFKCNIINNDVPEEDLDIEWFLNNDTSFIINADELVDLLEGGKLKGKLKEIAEKLNADDNPVLVKVKFKK